MLMPLSSAGNPVITLRVSEPILDFVIAIFLVDHAIEQRHEDKGDDGEDKTEPEKEQKGARINLQRLFDSEMRQDCRKGGKPSSYG